MVTMLYIHDRDEIGRISEMTHMHYLYQLKIHLYLVSEEEIYKDSANQNQELPMVAMFLQDDYM